MTDTYEPTPDECEHGVDLYPQPEYPTRGCITCAEKRIVGWLRHWENGPLDEEGSDPITGYLIVESGAITAFADAIERGEHREDQA